MPTIFKFSPKNSKKMMIIVAFLIFLVICTIIASFLSLLIVKTDSSAESVRSSSYEVYMLSLAKSQVEDEAKSRAGDFQKLGAGGFIWKQNDYYYVVSSVYQNKNDATLVQNSVKANQGLDSEIITVSFKSVTLSGNFTSDEKKVLTKALGAIYEYYLNIYDCAIALDTNVYNEISARLAVNSAHNTLNGVIDNLSTLFPEPAGAIKELSQTLEKALEESQKLCGGTLENQSQTYSSLLKYRYTSVLALYYELVEGN